MKSQADFIVIERHRSFVSAPPTGPLVTKNVSPSHRMSPGPGARALMTGYGVNPCTAGTKRLTLNGQLMIREFLHRNKGVGCARTAYVLYRPPPSLTSSHAATIFFIEAAPRKHIKNKHEAAKDTPLRNALATGPSGIDSSPELRSGEISQRTSPPNDQTRAFNQ